MLNHMIKKEKSIACLFAVIFFLAPVVLFSSQPPALLDHEIWEIKGQPGKLTWVVIHNREEAKQSGIVHIEIIARKKGAPEWSIEHVCNHMAITVDALSKSTIRSLKKGNVYPESFDSAYAEWQKQATKGSKKVCTTSLAECLK